MLRLTPRFVRNALIPTSYVLFLAGLVTSGAIFYHGRPFDPRIAAISALESADDNPHGYWAAATATAILGILLMPAVMVFYEQLRKGRPSLALAGAVVFGAGLAAAVAIGILAPFTHGYSLLHIQLAYVVFAGITGGSVLHLFAARAPWFLILPQVGVLLFLIYLYFGPEFYGQAFFNEDHFVTGLAFWEWLLCADCGAALWTLAHAVVKMDQAGRRPTALAAKVQA